MSVKNRLKINSVFTFRRSQFNININQTSSERLTSVLHVHAGRLTGSVLTGWQPYPSLARGDPAAIQQHCGVSSLFDFKRASFISDSRVPRFRAPVLPTACLRRNRKLLTLNNLVQNLWSHMQLDSYIGTLCVSESMKSNKWSRSFTVGHHRSFLHSDNVYPFLLISITFLSPSVIWTCTTYSVGSSM